MSVVAVIDRYFPQWLRQIYHRVKYPQELAEVHEVVALLDQYGAGSTDWIPSFQQKKLGALVEYAARYCPYYQRLFTYHNVRGLSDWANIPCLTKALIRENYRELVSNCVDQIHHGKCNTGGSTGEPLEFLSTALCSFIDVVHQKFQFRTMGMSPNDLVVSFDGVSVSPSRRKRGRFWIDFSKNAPYGSRSYSALYFNDENAPKYINEIQRTRPVFLRGYPSFLSALANYCEKHDTSMPQSIKGVELTAEIAYDFQVEKIKKIFKSPVYFQYGHTETCVFAYTLDETYEYFCSPVYGLVEILDDNQRPVAIGETGRVVATSFYNRAMPFIRYDTGDTAVYGGVRNGAVVLQKIVGRTQDYVIGSDRQKIPITGIVFGLHYKAFRNIAKWQIVQNVPGEIVFTIKKGVEYSDEDEEEISEIFMSQANVHSSFRYVEDFDGMTPRGKFRFFIQNCSEN
ncbi:MAG: hypothetical protein PHG74_10990 [Kiritimatiellae bacterium]|jgi:phenylacetate-CoA ligase|nr:hypothetical protein [Kiritimatiellia bacterium]MDD3584527.1 hypothetical protein [Kiritimatiellia bacterium]